MFGTKRCACLFAVHSVLVVDSEFFVAVMTSSFGYTGSQSAFGPPSTAGPAGPNLATHWAQQAAQHALRNPHDPVAQQQAAQWAAQAAALGAPHQGYGAGHFPNPPPAGGFPMGQGLQASPPPPPSSWPGVTQTPQFAQPVHHRAVCCHVKFSNFRSS